MEFDLKKELRNFRLGTESINEDLWSPDAEEGNKISAGEIEIVNQVKEIRGDDNLIEDQTSENETLEDLIVATESHSNLKRIEEVALRLTISQLHSYQKEVGVGILAGESFGTCDFRTLAIESLKDKLKTGIDKVVEMAKAIWEKVVAFFKKLFSSDKKLLAKLEAVKKAIEQSELQGGLKLAPKDYFVNLSIDGKVDAKTITGTFARLSRLHDANTLTISKILETEGKDPKAFNTAVMGEYYKIVETIAENTDATENNEKITYINDAWEYGIERGEGDSSKIFIRSRKAKSLSEISTLSKEDALSTVKNIETILGINNDEILKTANTIIRKIKFDSRLFKEFAPELSALGRFVIERAKLRHDISSYAINFLEENLKSKADSSEGSSSNPDRAYDEKVFANLKTAMKDKDLVDARTALLNLILDMALRTESLRNYANLANRNLPDLFKDFEVNFQAEELKLDKKDWTAEYFHEQNISLESNFSLERMRHLIDVREYLTKNGVEGFRRIKGQTQS